MPTKIEIAIDWEGSIPIIPKVNTATISLIPQPLTEIGSAAAKLVTADAAINS